MSVKIRDLYYALWIAHPVLEAGIVGVMLWRGLHRQFKFFFGYIVTQVLTFAIIFSSSWNNRAAFFYLYWVSCAISVLIGFAVIHEVFLDVFRAFHTLRDLGTVLFKWAGLVMLLVAAVVAVSSTSPETTWWMQAIFTTQRCVRIIQVGMILLLLFFSRYLGVSRRQQSFGIALGFGCFAVVELALLSSWVGNHMTETTVGLVNMVAYNTSLLVWVVYAVAKSPAREATSTLLKPQRWEQSLSDIQHPLPADSLIPMFEGMVDRALSRNGSAASSEEERAGNGSAASIAPLTLSALAKRAGSKT